MPERWPPLQIVDQLADIPTFADEDQEAAFWGSHRLSPALLEHMTPLAAEIAPPALLARLQTVARQRQVPYQRLLKQFLEERLDQLEAGDERASPPTAPDSETVQQTARSIARLARDLETAVASLQR